TISAEQFAYTEAKIAEAGLTDRITLLCSDYRLLSGQYDRLVSIEMIEAVGHKYLSGYFNKISTLLSHDGLALIQSITMNDQRYKSYKNSVDFIRKYIFPGGHLPSISLINRHIAEQTDMTLSHFEDITSHYARTLNEWQVRFVENFDQLPADKYDAQFFRMWRYYLSYCEGAFLERAIGTSQIVFSKSKATVDWEF
ncbi:MAG: class I SAM-dependent methyltransferase, partial [Reinekea forsetii]|nr:class I SAM-dependent methyltransferase [Reinekea forsetii]